MEPRAVEAGRIQRISSSRFEGIKTGKSFTKPEGKEAEPCRSQAEAQSKREQGKHQWNEAWNRKKLLPLDTRKPCITKPPSCASRGRRLVTRSLAPGLEYIYQSQPQRMFSAQAAQNVMKSVLEKTLKDTSYDGPGCSQLAVDVAEEVKQAIRGLGYERYKLVCYVVLGPVGRTGLYCSSRSIWSPESDTYAEYIFRNSLLFAVCVVFASYYE